LHAHVPLPDEWSSSFGCEFEAGLGFLRWAYLR